MLAAKLNMNLERTKSLIHEEINIESPVKALIHVLESTLELINLPDNDFCWSSWGNQEDAVKEVIGLIDILKNGGIPERIKVSVLFAPTGPLQEVSLSSGWAEAFIKVSEKYDQVEELLWHVS